MASSIFSLSFLSGLEIKLRVSHPLGEHTVVFMFWKTKLQDRKAHSILNLYL
jgi:hypothetical protein